MQHIIEKYDLFIKDQIAHQERASIHCAEKQDEIRALAYQDRAKKLQEMWFDIQNAAQSYPQPSIEAQFHLLPEELEGLPDDLIKELGITESDRKEYLLIELINKLGGITSINKLLVALFKETQEVEKRSRLVGRLYRMQNKGLIYTSSDRKGVYATKPIPDGYFSKDLEEDSDESIEE